MPDFLHREMLIVALSFAGVFFVLLAIFLPFLSRDKRQERIKMLTQHREDLSEQLRAEMSERAEKRARARTETQVSLMKKLLERFRLENLMASASIRKKLATGGWRGRSAIVTFVFLRFSLAGVCALFSFVIITFSSLVDVPLLLHIPVIGGSSFLGYFLPDFYVKNVAQKRRQELDQYFPEVLDLLGICVNAGQSIEAAFNRVTEDIFEDSLTMSQEIGLAAAELAFLGDRTAAYRNFAERTDLPAARSLSTSLSQSEKYGTPLSDALRILSEENRGERLSKVEKKAASLPAKLTVPMILFFLPALFAVILGPAIISSFQ
jgi:tight adherence protein C